jgi:hypothetical protein
MVKIKSGKIKSYWATFKKTTTAYLYLLNVSEMPIYFLLQVLQVKLAPFVSEHCINLCVLTKSVENIFCFCARGCVAFEDVAGGLICGFLAYREPNHQFFLPCSIRIHQIWWRVTGLLPTTLDAFNAIPRRKLLATCSWKKLLIS